MVLKFLDCVGAVGKKIFDAQQDNIKADMSDADMMTFYKAIQPKLERLSTQEFSPKEEMFNIGSSKPSTRDTPQDKPTPSWAVKMQNDIDNLRDKMGNSELDSEEELYYNADSKKHNKRFTKCNICKRKGHKAEQCYKRVCVKCHGMGHDKEKCPSQRYTRPITDNDKKGKGSTKYEKPL